MHTKFCDDWSCGSRDMIADRHTQTDRQTDRNTLLLYWGGVMSVSKQRQLAGGLKRSVVHDDDKLIIDNLWDYVSR